MKPSTICLTGGTGFIGRHFLRRLERENVRVRALTRAAAPATSGSPATNLQFIQGDLLDRNSLRDFPEKESVVVHLAYLSAKSREENILALENLTDACVAAGISRFIHVSTAIVAGDVTAAQVTETTECKPATDYEITKLKLESVAARKLEGKCQLAVLRPTCVFGASGQNLVKLAQDLAADAKLVKHLKRSLFDRRPLNLVSVQNVVEALWFLATVENELRGEIFIVSEDGAPQNNYADVSSFLASALHFDMPRWPQVPGASVFLPLALRLIRQSRRNPYVVYSCEKLERFGFEKAIPFDEGLKLFVEWYQRELST